MELELDTPYMLARIEDGVGWMTFNNPDRRNAMTEAMGDALATAVDQLVERDELRAVVLTGEPPAFSAGGDLGMLEELGRRTREERFDASFVRENVAGLEALREAVAPFDPERVARRADRGPTPL